MKSKSLVWESVAPGILALRNSGKSQAHAVNILKMNSPKIKDAARGVASLYRYGCLPRDLFWSQQTVEDAL